MRAYFTSAVKALLFFAAIVLASFPLSRAANAVTYPITWTLSPNIAFSDGGTLNGFFNINQYDVTVPPWDLVTAGGSTNFGVDYNASINANDPNVMTVEFNAPATPEHGAYSSWLYIVFQNSLLVPSANNPIVGGLNGPSFECENYDDGHGNCTGVKRYILGGYASADGTTAATPLPAALPLFAGGAGVIGFFARGRRRKNFSA